MTENSGPGKETVSRGEIHLSSRPYDADGMPNGARSFSFEKSRRCSLEHWQGPSTDRVPSLVYGTVPLGSDLWRIFIQIDGAVNSRKLYLHLHAFPFTNTVKAQASALGRRINVKYPAATTHAYTYCTVDWDNSTIYTFTTVFWSN
jgi:hypothetical protein